MGKKNREVEWAVSFAQVLGGIASGSAHNEVFVQLKKWGNRFAKGATRKWARTLLSRADCFYVTNRGNPCRNHAVHECITCGEAVCLEHAYMSGTAELICVQCVRDFKAAIAQEDEYEDDDEYEEETWEDFWQQVKEGFAGDTAATGDPQLRRALRIFGLDEGARFEEVQARFKVLAREFHPDKFTEEKQRKQAEVRFKAITEAYHVCDRVMNRRAA